MGNTLSHTRDKAEASTSDSLCDRTGTVIGRLKVRLDPRCRSACRQGHEEQETRTLGVFSPRRQGTHPNEHSLPEDAS